MVGSCFIGWLTPYPPPQAKTASPAANMFLAAFISAFSQCPQFLHSNLAWMVLFSDSV